MALTILFVLFLAVHVAGALFAGSGSTWGFEAWGRVPPLAAILGLASIGAGAILVLRLPRGAGERPVGPRWKGLAIRAGLSLPAAVPFVLLRSFVVYGDGAESYEVFVRGNPGTSFLFRVVGAVLESLLGTSPAAEAVVAIASCAAGVVYVFFALLLARVVCRGVPQQAVFVLVVTSMGSLQLFFGYVEVYGTLAAGTMAYVYVAALYLRGRVSIWVVTLVLSIVFLLHMSAGWFLPSLLALPFLAGRTPPRPAVFARMAGVFAAPLAVYVFLLFQFLYGGDLARMERHYEQEGATIFVGNMTGGADHSRWVPLFEATLETERYTMFSVGHLVEFLNNHLLATGFSSVFVAWLLVSGLRGAQIRDPFLVFGYLLAGFYLLYSFVWNPGYAAAGDWDLFAVTGNCFAVLSAYGVVSIAPEGGSARAAAILLAANWVGSVPWILSNHLAG